MLCSSVLLVCSLVTMATMGRSQLQAVEVLYHSAVNFTCSEPPGPPPSGGDQVRRMWILPSDDLVEAGTRHERVEVQENGTVLHVLNVEDEDFGWYYCLVRVTSAAGAEERYSVSRHGLNVQGPYWGDLYQLRYKGMLSTGLIAGAICFVAMGAVCFFYDRQETRLDKPTRRGIAPEAVTEDTDKRGTSTQGPVTQHDNPAFENDSATERPPETMTRPTAITNAEESSSQKGPAPLSPHQHELRDMAAADTGVSGGDTRL
ncbi:uncharacterized protein LOC143298946 [Babylonia areolata]|uniref:uncharacterized protein LOC143298946 n=1 Tax=Babylonia areolata TaxID=304850 RepID=UPI003FD0B820